jgi:hypothetical protein
MDETVLDSPELESALEERHEMRERVRAVLLPYQKADEKAKGLIAELVPEGTVARVGRFRVERKASAPKHVEFDTKASVRTLIVADGDE